MERARTVLSSLKDLSWYKYLVPLLFAGAYFKNLLLRLFLSGSNFFAPSPVENGRTLFFGLFFGFFSCVLIFCPVLLFKRSRGRCVYALSAGAVFTLLCIVNVCYFRYFNDLFSVSLFSMAGDAAGEGFLTPGVIFGLFSPWDLLFFADFFLILPVLLFKLLWKPSPESAENEKDAAPAEAGAASKFKAFFAVSEGKGFAHFFLHTRPGHTLLVLAVCLPVFLALPVLNLFGVARAAFTDVYDPVGAQDFAFFFTPFGYQICDVGNTVATAANIRSRADLSAALPSDASLVAPDRSYWIVPLSGENARDRKNPPDYTGSEAQTAQIDEFYAFRDSHRRSSALSGTLAGKNLLFLQIESLENCVLGQSVNGKEITPFLNSLLSSNAPTISFTALHDQVKGGNSSDCDLMINTGLLPTSSSASGIFFRSHLDKTVPTAADLLREDGYRIMHINGSGAKCAWDYQAAYRDVFGFNTDTSDPDCEFYLLQASEEVKIEKYLRDEKIFDFVYRKMLETDPARPWYIHTVTTSSHMPFTGIYKLPEDQLLIVPEDKENNTYAYLNGVHYVDEQLRVFFEKAGAAGLLDNTVVVIYGDHKGLHKYYPQNAADTAAANPELSFLEAESDPAIAFLIYDPSGSVGRGTVSSCGGQIDITPTVLDLLGIDPARYGFMMGRSLLSSDADFTILQNGALLGGDGLTEEEKRIVRRMYQTCDVIITTNYTSKYLKE